MTLMATAMAALVISAVLMCMLLVVVVVLVSAERPAEPRVRAGARAMWGLVDWLRSRPGPMKSPRRAARHPAAMAKPLVQVEAPADEVAR